LKSLLLKNNSKYIPNTDTTINIDSSQQQIQIRLTAHLGLIVPKLSSESQEPKCYAQVADTICTWEEGKALVFDDSYEHEVVLKSSSSSSSQEDEQPEQMRSVLLIQFWYPCLIIKQKTLEEALYTKTLIHVLCFHRHLAKTIIITIHIIGVVVQKVQYVQDVGEQDMIQSVSLTIIKRRMESMTVIFILFCLW
jgi:Aspartyl/Asparaginyl beta-hydroxylase